MNHRKKIEREKRNLCEKKKWEFDMENTENIVMKRKNWNCIEFSVDKMGR